MTPLTGQIRFECKIDKNLKFNPVDSEALTYIQQHGVNEASFICDFYSYDGDGLVGHVDGEVVANF